MKFYQRLIDVPTAFLSGDYEFCSELPVRASAKASLVPRLRGTQTG